MKNHILLFCLMSLTIAAFSQSTAPRWDGDFSGRSLNYAKKTITDATGADTVKVNPNASQTFISASIVDSVVINVTPITRSYYGDKITYLFTNASGSGHKVEFLTTNVELATAGKITLKASKRANIVFIFDGVKWIELSRSVQ